ncbi:hypothetical protein F4808DRAFT_461273 [Astrocystis sublimbata]|nr:hypothetical protein F4808DRAFT_461273 [Astrocystis sublimbata]
MTNVALAIDPRPPSVHHFYIRTIVGFPLGMMRSFTDSVGDISAAPAAVIASLSILTISFLAHRYYSSSSPAASGPKTLVDPIPRLFNMLQFMLFNHRFMSRAQAALRGGNYNTSLLRFNLGPKKAFESTITLRIYVMATS